MWKPNIVIASFLCNAYKWSSPKASGLTGLHCNAFCPFFVRYDVADEPTSGPAKNGPVIQVSDNNTSLIDCPLCEWLTLLLHPSYATHTNDHLQRPMDVLCIMFCPVWSHKPFVYCLFRGSGPFVVLHVGSCSISEVSFLCKWQSPKADILTGINSNAFWFLFWSKVSSISSFAFCLIDLGFGLLTELYVKA